MSMCSGFECLKLNINFGGDVRFRDESFAYIGGLESKEMLMDPDLMTWSVFENFCQKNAVNGEVEEIWYKLPHEDLASARRICEDKDGGIRKLCSEALVGGEVDLYIQVGLSKPAPFPLSTGEDCLGQEFEGSDEEGEQAGENHEDQPDLGEDPVEEVRQDDPRFQGG